MSTEKRTLPGPGKALSGGTRRDLAPPPANPSEPPPPMQADMGERPTSADVSLESRSAEIESKPQGGTRDRVITRRFISSPAAPAPVDHLREEETPFDGMDVRAVVEETLHGSAKVEEPSPADRAQFRTAPGGGKNRISGGRTSASAYVSPITVAPSTGTTPVTSAIKVHEIVKNEARTFVTEPSLLKRRASSLPPSPPGYDDPPQRKAVWYVGLGAALVGGLIVYLVATRADTQPERSAQSELSQEPEKAVQPESAVPPESAAQQVSPAQQALAHQSDEGPGARAPAATIEAAEKVEPAAKIEKARNQAVVGPNQGKTGESSAPKSTQQTTLPTKSAVVVPAQKPSPDAGTEKKPNDLWLE